MAANDHSEDEPNPYKSPKTESDSQPPVEVDPIYRLHRFLLVVVAAVIGAILGYLITPFFGTAKTPKEAGAIIGVFVGLFFGVVFRIATRRR